MPAWPSEWILELLWGLLASEISAMCCVMGYNGMLGERMMPNLILCDYETALPRGFTGMLGGRGWQTSCKINHETVLKQQQIKVTSGAFTCLSQAGIIGFVREA
jgi:hypothetical protein